MGGSRIEYPIAYTGWWSLNCRCGPKLESVYCVPRRLSSYLQRFWMDSVWPNGLSHDNGDSYPCPRGVVNFFRNLFVPVLDN